MLPSRVRIPPSPPVLKIMPYLSLARKYRPQVFDEIVGQEHVATTLKNAIGMERVAHAYLFAGPRGVGKTSTARILAKSLNCQKGPTVTPCGKCASCREISQGTNMDVVEIDGASNRGIDEIRNLKENVKFSPMGGKFRIYIIDEVHMLTQEAFNALLKTLEEPPPHVKFIFATTRPHKVLPTIISRCQRFDFRKISIPDIVTKLEDVKKREKLDLKDEAVFLIAKASDGSMRDAEVILDQLLSFTKGKIAARDVVKVLGILEKDTLFNIIDCVLRNDKEKILFFVSELTNNGKDPIFIATSIIDHMRSLLVAKVAEEKGSSYTAASEAEYHKLREQARGFSLDEIMYVIYTLSAAIDLMKKTSLSQIPLEISLIKLTDRKKLIPIKDILTRLSGIEKRLLESPEAQPSQAASRMARAPEESRRIPKTLGPVAETPQDAPAPAIPEEDISAERDILLLQKIKTSWQKIINLIKQIKMSVATFLFDGELLGVRDNVLVVGFSKNNLLHKEALEDSASKKIVEEAIRNVIEEKVYLKVEVLERQAQGETGGAGAAGEGVFEEEAPEERSARIEPIVESAIDIFGGTITDIRKEKPKGIKK